MHDSFAVKSLDLGDAPLEIDRGTLVVYWHAEEETDEAAVLHPGTWCASVLARGPYTAPRRSVQVELTTVEGHCLSGPVRVHTEPGSSFMALVGTGALNGWQLLLGARRPSALRPAVRTQTADAGRGHEAEAVPVPSS